MAIKQVYNQIYLGMNTHQVRTMEDIVTQENLPSSGDEEPVDGPLSQYYDVEMELNQPPLDGNSLDSHATPLFAPDRNSPLHPQYTTNVLELNQPQLGGNSLDSHATPLFTPDRNSPLHPQYTSNAPTDYYASDTYESHHSPIKRFSDDDRKADSSTPTKRMKKATSPTVRKANRQLVDISTRQREALHLQEERLQASLRQQNKILHKLLTVQRHIQQERQQFEERIAQTEREKANRETELINEIKTIKVGCYNSFTTMLTDD
jgi:hypothetical protein